MIGRTVGRYRIVSRLGEGGMGTVWKAEDPLLGRTLALKFLAPRLSDSRDAARRFLREARAASTLTHPGIAAVYDAGESEGQVYIAFQYVDGETVSDRIARALVPEEEAVRVAAEAAEALEHAHRHGVLHRDISARNLMLDRDGHVVVVDFGLALPKGETRLTQTGTTMGTVPYMAPEVIQGKASDHRSDLYALGVVLYEMLTGRHPFPADRAEAVLYAAVHTAAEAPGQRRAGLSGGVDQVALMALAKEPGRRYQSAAAMAADLRACQSGQTPLVAEQAGMSLSQAPTAPVSLPPGAVARPREGARMTPAVARPGTAPAAARRVGWRRRLWLGSVVALGVLGVVVALSGWRGWRPFTGGTAGPRFGSVAVLPLQNLSAEKAESDYLVAGLSQALITRLTQGLDLRVTPWMTTMRYADVKRPLTEVAKELGVEALVVGTISRAGDRLHASVALVDGGTGFQIWAEEFDERFSDLFAVQKRIAVGAATRLRGSLTGRQEESLARNAGRVVDAYDLYMRGSELLQKSDRPSNERAIGFFQKAAALDPMLAEAHLGLGAGLTDRFFYGWGGAENLRQAEANYRKALALDPSLTQAVRGLIQVKFDIGRNEDCLAIGREAARTGRDDVETLMVRAQAYALCGLPDKAVPLFEQVIELDPMNPAAHWFMVFAQVWAGQHEAAIESGDEYIWKFGDDPEVHTWMGVAAYELGMHDQAAGHFDKALSLFPTEGSNGYVFIFAGRTFAEQREDEKARRTWLQGYDWAVRHLQETDNPRVRGILATLSAMLGKSDQFKAEEERLWIQMQDGPFCLSPMFIVSAHALLGDREAAVASLRRIERTGCHLAGYIGQNMPKFFGLEMVKDRQDYRDFIQDLSHEHDRLAATY